MMGLLDFLLGSEDKKSKNAYEEGLSDGYEKLDWNYEKLKDKKYAKGFFDAVDEDNCEDDR